MKAAAAKKRQHQEAHRPLLPAVPRPDMTAAAAAAEETAPTKGCATFLVGEEGKEQQRFAMPVARLGHPRIVELLEEAAEEYGFAQAGAVVVPCSIDRFRQAVEAATAGGRGRPGFHLGHLLCFRPSHVVA